MNSYLTSSKYIYLFLPCKNLQAEQKPEQWKMNGGSLTKHGEECIQLALVLSPPGDVISRSIKVSLHRP